MMMKQIIPFIFTIILLVSCVDSDKKTDESTTEANTSAETVDNNESAFQHFGDKINDQDVISDGALLEQYKNMKPGDTVEVKFAAKVKSVCQKKGCWMRLDLGEKEAFVKFKDYGFFMPTDIAGEEAIVYGKAFVEETSVDDLKHFAMDGGKSQEEVDAITEPELSYSFLSSGVLLPTKQ